MPVLTVAYGLRGSYHMVALRLLNDRIHIEFYDKAVLGSASVFGIIEDLVGLYYCAFFMENHRNHHSICPPSTMESLLPNDILRLMLHFTVNMHRHAREFPSQSTYILDGYIVGVLPIALILQRVPLVKTLSAFIFLWGVICMLTVVVTSYPGLVVQRIFLGMVEVSVKHSPPQDRF